MGQPYPNQEFSFKDSAPEAAGAGYVGEEDLGSLPFPPSPAPSLM